MGSVLSRDNVYIVMLKIPGVFTTYLRTILVFQTYPSGVLSYHTWLLIFFGVTNVSKNLRIVQRSID